MQRGGGHRGLGIDEHLERVVVDDHLLGGVLALAAGLADDDGDRLADEAHLADGQVAAGDGGLNAAGSSLTPRSSAVSTAMTPGISSAADVSIPVIVPWATDERT